MRFSFRFVGGFLEVSLVIGLELARFGLGFEVMKRYSLSFSSLRRIVAAGVAGGRGKCDSERREVGIVVYRM